MSKRMRADVRGFCLFQYTLSALICPHHKSQCRSTSEQFLNFGDFFQTAVGSYRIVCKSCAYGLGAKAVRVRQPICSSLSSLTFTQSTMIRTKRRNGCCWRPKRRFFCRPGQCRSIECGIRERRCRSGGKFCR